MRHFSTEKFKSFLLAGTFTAFIGYVNRLSDSVIIGHVIALGTVIAETLGILALCGHFFRKVNTFRPVRPSSSDGEVPSSGSSAWRGWTIRSSWAPRATACC